MKASSLAEKGKTALESTTTAKGASKAAQPKVMARRSNSKTTSRTKSEKLTCRYCGSSDLAPSFIKRRDRRCRKCFSKRYASKSGPKATKVRKK